MIVPLGYRRLVVLLGVACSLLFLWAFWIDALPSPSAVYNSALRNGAAPQSSQAPQPSETPSWSYDPLRDASNHGLTEEQCNAAFPGLFEEPHRAAEFVRSQEKNRISPEDISLDAQRAQLIRAMIYEKELYIIDKKKVDWTRERSISILGQIHRAITAYTGPLPNIEWTMALDDAAWDDVRADKWPLWTLSRGKDKPRHWVMPGFGFWAYTNADVGSYTEVRRKIKQFEPAYEDKIDKAVWRGSVGLNPTRGKLIQHAKNMPWADVRGTSVDDPEGRIKTTDFCNYKFVIHTEGSANSGRLIYLHQCHSVLIVPELHWVEPQTVAFITEGPDQNVVQVKKDFSDIDEKMQDLLANPEKARRIADNSIATFRDRYVTPAAVSCYWRSLIRAWGTVSFEPNLFGTVNVTDPDTCLMHEEEGGWRGQSYERYLHSQTLYGRDKCVTKEQREKDRKKKEEEDRKKKEEAAKKKEEEERKKKEEEERKQNGLA